MLSDPFGPGDCGVPEGHQHDLHISGELCNAAIELSADIVFLADKASTKILEVNPAFQRTLGYARDDALGLMVRDIIVHDEGSIDPHMDQICRDLQGIAGEWKLRRRDGSMVDVSVDARLVDFNGREALCIISRDITELKKAERSAKLYQLFSNMARDMILLIAGDGRIIDANDAAVNAYGFKRDELISKNIRDLRDPETLDDVSRQMKQASQEGILFQTRHMRKDGSIFPVEVSSRGAAIDGEHFLLSIIRHITERKRSEDREHERSHILEVLASGAPLSTTLSLIAKSVERENPSMLCSIHLTDESGRSLVHGSAPSLPEFYCRSINGIKIGPGVGSCGTAAFSGARVIVEDVQSHPYWAQFRDLAYMAGLRSCWSEPIISAGGEVLGTFAIYHRETGSPSGRDIQLIKHAADIARIAIEHERAKDALQNKEKDYRTVFDSVPAMVWYIDLDGKILQANKTTSEILGLEADEIIGRNTTDIFKPEEAARFLEDNMEVIGSGKPKVDIVEPYTKPDGQKRWAQTDKIPYCDDGGEIIGVIIFVKDITEHKQAEEDLLASLKEKEVLLREIHHRVKNNLQVVSSLLSIQARYARDRQTRDAFSESQNRIRSIALVHEMLYKSENLARIDLREYIGNLTGSLMRSYGVEKVKGVRLYLDLDEVALGIDRAISFGLIVNELFTNCLKHAFPGSRAGEVHVGLHQDGGRIVLSVRDNGAGLPEDFNIQKAKSMGLTLVRSLVMQHKGTIEVQSGDETEFRVIFEGSI